jgi:hypothetical protein
MRFSFFFFTKSHMNVTSSYTRPVRLACQLTVNNIFLSEQTSHQQQPTVFFSQNKSALATMGKKRLCPVMGRARAIGLFVWLVADGWCWFVLREKYCWLVAGLF